MIFLEDLEIKNLLRRCKAKLGDNGQLLPNGQATKSGHNKSLQDAGFGQFVQVLEYVAWKLGKRVIKVNPRGTSGDRWHSCTSVLSLSDDPNATTLINQEDSVIQPFFDFELRNQVAIA